MADAPPLAADVSTPVADKPLDVGNAPNSQRAYRLDPPQVPHPTSISEADKPAVAAIADRDATAATATRRASQSLPDAARLPLWSMPSEVFSDLKASAGSLDAGRGVELAATIIRFLLLVALFTAAGLSVLLMHGRGLSPDAIPADALAPPVDESVAVPTAVGPARTVPHPPQVVDNPRAAAPPTIVVAEPQPDLAAESEQRDEYSPKTPIYPETPYPAPVLSDCDQSSLPTARTTDPPPVVARLPGFILDAQPRQSEHENHESSVY